MAGYCLTVASSIAKAIEAMSGVVTALSDVFSPDSLWLESVTKCHGFKLYPDRVCDGNHRTSLEHEGR